MGWLFSALGGLILALLVLFVLQRRLIYLPLIQQVPDPVQVLPGAREVRFPTADGLELSGWLVPAAGEPAQGTVLVLNGNAGHRGHRAPLAAALSRRGYRVLLFDYRGYGGNPGRPSEAGLALDARAARDFLVGQMGVDGSRLAYYGESLGAAVALELALEHPPEALILRSPFTSLVEAGELHYPLLPVRWLLWDRFPSLERIGQLKVPLLVVAGGADGLIPPEMSRRLYQAAPEPKRFVLVAGAGHNDPQLLDGEVLIGEMSRFLTEFLP